MKLNKNIRYSNLFLGIVPASNQVDIVDRIKTAIKGTGFSLRRCARNANREQFYGMYTGRMTYSIKLGHAVRTQRGRLQQDLPLKHATHIALYLKPHDCRNYPMLPTVKQKVANALAGVRCPNGGGVLKSVAVDKIHEVVTAIAAW